MNTPFRQFRENHFLFIRILAFGMTLLCGFINATIFLRFDFGVYFIAGFSCLHLIGCHCVFVFLWFIYCWFYQSWGLFCFENILWIYFIDMRLGFVDSGITFAWFTIFKLLLRFFCRLTEWIFDPQQIKIKSQPRIRLLYRCRCLFWKAVQKS